MSLARAASTLCSSTADFYASLDSEYRCFHNQTVHKCYKLAISALFVGWVTTKASYTLIVDFCRVSKRLAVAQVTHLPPRFSDLYKIQEEE